MPPQRHGPPRPARNDTDYANLVLLDDAREGLDAAARGEVLDEADLDRLLEETLRFGAT